MGPPMASLKEKGNIPETSPLAPGGTKLPLVGKNRGKKAP